MPRTDSKAPRDSLSSASRHDTSQSTSAAPGFIEQELFEAVDVAMVAYAEDEKLLYANRAALSLFAGSIDPLLDLTSSHPGWHVLGQDGASLSSDDRPVARVLRQQSPVKGVTLALRSPDQNRLHWLLVNASPRFSQAGDVAYVLVTLTDISSERQQIHLLERSVQELRRTAGERMERLSRAEENLRYVEQGRALVERALAEREQLYSSVFSASSEGIAFHDHTGAVVAANNAAQQILGLSLEQMVGQAAVDPRWKLVGPDGRPLPPELTPVEITLHTGERCRHRSLGVYHPSGEVTWLRMSTDALRDYEDGPVRGIVATFADVTVEREAVLELERSRAQFKQVTEAIPGVLFQYQQTGHSHGTFTFISAQAEDVLGVANTAVLNDPESFWRLMTADAQAAARHQMGSSAAGKGLWAQDFRVPRPDNDRWLRVCAVAAQAETEVIWSGVILDVTEEHRLGAQLLHTQRREAVGDLAAGVAHNFNNMLAAVIPNLEECARCVPEELKPLVDDSLHAARAGSDLVRQLLQMSRRDSLDRTEPIDAVNAVREVARLCKRSFDRKVEIEIQESQGEAVLLGPPGCLHQVLLNLCINARDAMTDSPNPRLVLSAGIQTQPDGGPCPDVLISVSDNGTGMSAQTLKRLGEPFYTTKAPGRGTGLGLATVYFIVRDLGGDIQCTSTIGHGTRFEIRLPGVAPETLRRVAVQSMAPQQFDSERILVIDDEPLVRRAIARKLRHRGLDPVEVEDGVEALRFLSSKEAADISAVLLDLSMPLLSGEEVLASLAITHAALPVIVVTGHVPDRAALSSAAAVLVKPIGDTELFRAVASALNPAGSSDSHHAQPSRSRAI